MASVPKGRRKAALGAFGLGKFLGIDAFANSTGREARLLEEQNPSCDLQPQVQENLLGI
jgi:hypothetical protein